MLHILPEIKLMDKNKPTYLIINIAIPWHECIRKSMLEKIDNYQLMKNEPEKLWIVKIAVISVVVDLLCL